MTEDRIIEAAKALFVEKGFAETSMSDIAARAGINRPGLHYYFRTKDKMFQAVFGDIIQEIIPKVFSILLRRDEPISRRVEDIVDTYYALFLANPRLPMFMVREINRDVSRLMATAEQLALPGMLDAVVESLHGEMEAGKLRDVPLRFLFYTLYGMLVMPFLTQDAAKSVLLEPGETFEEMLAKWKPYVIAQMTALLVPEGA